MPSEDPKLSGLLPILGKLHDGAMLVDHDMSISFANKAVHEMFGYNTPELVGSNISKHFTPVMIYAKVPG